MEQKKLSITDVNLRDSLLAKVNGIIIIILVILVSILGFTINNLVSNQLTKSAEERNLEVANSLRIKADGFLERAESMIKLLAKEEEVRNLNSARMKENFQRVKEEESFFKTIYLGTKEGEMITYPQVELPTDYKPQDRPWYTTAKQKDKLAWTEIYIDSNTNKPIVTVAKPITNSQGEFIGVLAGDFSLQALSDLIAEREVGQAGYAYMIDQQGQVMAHPDQKLVTDQFNITELFSEDKVFNQAQGSFSYKHNEKDKLASYATVERLGSKILVQAPFSQVYSAVDKIRFLLIVIGLVTLVVLSGSIYFVINKFLVAPIKALITSLTEIAQGDLTTEIGTAKERKDELGCLEAAVNNMVTNLKEIIISLLESAEDLSAYSEELSASSEEGNAAIERTNELIDNISAGIQQVSASTQEVSSFSASASQKATTGDENVEQALESMKQINQSVEEAVAVITDLEDKSEEINQIVEMITGIAEQTDLLALNAAIEAARAGSDSTGEKGTGFAVVAEEIRELAKETNQATQKIASLIQETQDQTATGLETINQVKENVQQGQDIVQTTASIFQEIKDANQKTADQVAQTASATQGLAQDSDQLLEAADNIEQMSEEITTSSQELANMAQKLQSLVDEFTV